MSHIVRIVTEVRDAAAVQAACQNFGYEAESAFPKRLSDKLDPMGRPAAILEADADIGS